jgi:hypothetical protein
MLRYLLAAGTAAAAAAVLFTGTAAAQPGDEPVSGDARTTAHSGNVVAADCAELFKSSTAIATSDLTYSVDETNTYVDITAVADGVEVVGVIVKGGPAYNVYTAASLGALAWNDLHSPLVSSGKPAQISHWFACGTKTTTTTTTTETTTETTDTTTAETTTETSGTESSSSPPTTTTSDSSSAGAGVTTTSAGVSPAAEEGDLASTGFNGGWLIALAGLLLAGGGALLLLMRLRAARR